MELFSKRNSERDIRMRSMRYRTEKEELRNQIIQDTLRIRLQEEVRYLISSGKYLERFLYVNNQLKDKIYLHDSTLRDLSMRVLGYSLKDILDCTSLSFENEDYSDIKFFDLLELLIIFTKNDSRKEVVARLNEIFKEEGDIFIILGFMITDKRATGLRPLIPLVKDSILRNKLFDLFSQSAHTSEYEIMAKTSAEVIQYLFSSPKSKTKTKQHSENLCLEMASKWTEKKSRLDLSTLLSETVKNAKELSNQISNIRHTDQHTIRVESPSLYKLIAQKNIALIELVVLSLPEKYISKHEPDELKNSYIKNYNVDKSTQWVVKKKTEDATLIFPPDDINPDDIPF